ncbi:Mobile element protein [Polaromonas sp. CG9_12]|nr:Mobile element protein [Polaromonas sp. CG9_12]
MIAPQASAAFVAVMEQVLDIYGRPYDVRPPVVCMDETPRQLIRETREPIAAAPGRPERHDYEYERCGACKVFRASEPLAGRRLSKVTERRTKADWALFVQAIAASYPEAARITLVMDNLNTHTPASLYEACAPEQAKVNWQFTTQVARTKRKRLYPTMAS